MDRERQADIAETYYANSNIVKLRQPLAPELQGLALRRPCRDQSTRSYLLRLAESRSLSTAPSSRTLTSAPCRPSVAKSFIGADQWHARVPPSLGDGRANGLGILLQAKHREVLFDDHVFFKGAHGTQ